MQRIGFEVEGMSCGHCVAAVRRALEGQDGVKVEDVTMGSARVAYDPGRTSPDALAAAIEDAGYPARSVETAG